MRRFGKTVLTLLTLALVAGCATATPQLPTAQAPAQMPDLGTVVRADVQRALEIAQAAQDPAGVACASALLAHLIDRPAPQPPAGVFSAFMVAREARRRVDRGVGEEIHNACAPLVLDTAITLGKVGLGLVPGGGLLPKVLGR